jgi:hypothetical protein
MKIQSIFHNKYINKNKLIFSLSDIKYVENIELKQLILKYTFLDNFPWTWLGNNYPDNYIEFCRMVSYYFN